MPLIVAVLQIAYYYNSSILHDPSLSAQAFFLIRKFLDIFRNRSQMPWSLGIYGFSNYFPDINSRWNGRNGGGSTFPAPCNWRSRLSTLPHS